MYNQKEHEKWQNRGETDIACVLVLADFEMRKRMFLGEVPEMEEFGFC